MIYWLSYIASCIAYNWYRIEKRGIEPTYFNSNWARGVFGIVGLVITYPYFDPLGDYTTIWKAMPVVGYEMSSFYLLFDPILNILRGKPVLYRGKTSGYLDKLGTTYYITLKVFTLIILIITIYALLRGTIYRLY